MSFLGVRFGLQVSDDEFLIGLPSGSRFHFNTCPNFSEHFKKSKTAAEDLMKNIYCSSI